MRLGRREILYTYSCGPYDGAKLPYGTRSEGNGLHMTLPRAIVWLVTGR